VSLDVPSQVLYDKLLGSMGRTLRFLGLGLLCLTPLATTASGLPRPAIDFPFPVDSYHDQQIPSLLGKLAGRIQREPLNLVATIIFMERSFTRFWPEYLYSAIPISAGFAGVSGPTATFFGPSEGHDSAIVSAGTSAQWTPALTVYVNYDGQLWRENYDSNAVTGGVRISF